MDRVIAKKKWNGRKITVVILSVIGGLLVFGSIFLNQGKSVLKVNVERITLSEVQEGNFQELIPVSGFVLPVSTIYLDAVEGGRVEEVYVEDGAMMKKGDPVLKLSNTDLELSLANQETAVFNLLTQMQISKNAATQNTIMRLTQGTDAENAYREAKRIYDVNKQLFDDKVIALQEFRQSENAYQYALQKKNLTDQILRQDSAAALLEIEQSRESFKRTQEALRIMRKKVQDLIVRAPADGQLTSLNAEAGQSKNKGERLGQIDATHGFKVRTEIDEHYISRIFPGLTGEFNLGAKKYTLVIDKVYAQIGNGKFQVDLRFQGETPKDVRRGQRLQIRLALSEESRALLLARGGFYQHTGGNWVFRLSKDGTVAYRTEIQLGRQNPDFYEVLQGLKEGDKVITSGYDNYARYSELVLTNK